MSNSASRKNALLVVSRFFAAEENRLDGWVQGQSDMETADRKETSDAKYFMACFAKAARLASRLSMADYWIAPQELTETMLMTGAGFTRDRERWESGYWATFWLNDGG